MTTEFTLFQEYFKEYQKLFGLTGYKVYFNYEPLETFAELSFNQNSRVVTARLNSKLPDKDKPHKDIKRSAKHEALHLFLSRLEDLALSRFTSHDEIRQEVEGLVFKLEDLIK